MCVHLCDALFRVRQGWMKTRGHIARSKPPGNGLGHDWHITESRTRVLRLAREGQQRAWLGEQGWVCSMEFGGFVMGSGRQTKQGARTTSAQEAPCPRCFPQSCCVVVWVEAWGKG